ncbi:MAG: ferrous iron transport protein B [Kiritimatiellia bacterium]
MNKQYNIAIAGNPNSGKTCIFNNITGARQHVGNYPGVTVEKKEGICEHKGMRLNIVDLPGTYSLTAYSSEEVVTRNYILNEKPDLIIDVIDASNLERNLYLYVQLMELGIPVLLAFNMMDIAEARGLKLDMKLLSSLLGAPIVETIGSKNTGTQRLMNRTVEMLKNNYSEPPPKILYGRYIEDAISVISEKVDELDLVSGELKQRWTAIKLLENDKEVVEQIKSDDVHQLVCEQQQRIEFILGDTAEMLIADHRYGFISGAYHETVRATIETRHTNSDRIDEIVLHRVWGVPVFLGMMYLLFWLTFTVGTPPMEWLASFFGWLGNTISASWSPDTLPALRDLIIDGLIAGVGGVLVFVPNIILLFLAIAMLEDSGYMARTAFIMDHLMHKIGLHGKSFIPLLTGFGCTVPAIMATRTLENRRDRLTTMFILPLISCGARLPIYALIIPAFFSEPWRAPILWCIYISGILLAILLARILRKTILKGDSMPFVMELPPYRLPTLKGLFIHTWEKAWMYIKKAGTVILGISIILWALTNYPKVETDPSLTPEQQRAEELSHTVAGQIGHAIEPALRPLGFDWKLGTAMIGAFAAKEVFVAQLGIVYSVGAADEESVPLREQLQKNYTPLTGICIMLFMLIATPCMATIAMTRRESGSWGWALFQLGGLTAMAYVITLAVYQVGSLFM